MVHSCCAYGCTNRFKKGSGIGFYRFPRNLAKRNIWIQAVKRKNWKPLEETRICGQHFQSGKPSTDPAHPDYVPNVFVFGKPKTNLDSFERRQRLYQKRNYDENSVHKENFSTNHDNSSDVEKTGEEQLCYLSVDNQSKPAEIKDLGHPDWLPSVKMGYEKNSETGYPFSAYTKKLKIVNCLDEKDERSVLEKRVLIDGELYNYSSEATSFQNKTFTGLEKLRAFLRPGNSSMIDTPVGSEWTSPSINQIFETYENSKKVNSNVDLITDQNLSFVKENFTFQFLLKNISLVKKPNYFWGVSPHSNIIICARWSEDYICEKRVVIENTLIVRAFLKKWEVNLSELMKITCIDDISNLLEKVESY